MNDETVWLTQDQMETLFDKGKSTITEPMKYLPKKEFLEYHMDTIFIK